MLGLRVSSVTAGIVSACALMMTFASGPAPAHASVRQPVSGPRISLEVQDVRPVMRAAAVRRSAEVRVHIVVKGDTLSGVARASYGQARCWPGVYNASKNVVGGNPDDITPGEQLIVPADCDSTPVATITAAVSTSRHSGSGAYGHPYYCGDGDGDGYDMPCSELHHGSSVAPARSSSPARTAALSGSYSTTSGFQSCVISRESGGNAQIWNASGHYGLYQFSEGTWVAAGGAAGMFGHASAAYQTEIFQNAYRMWGTSPWAPYDGC